MCRDSLVRTKPDVLSDILLARALGTKISASSWGQLGLQGGHMSKNCTGVNRVLLASCLMVLQRGTYPLTEQRSIVRYALLSRLPRAVFLERVFPCVIVLPWSKPTVPTKILMEKAKPCSSSKLWYAPSNSDLNQLDQHVSPSINS